MDRSERDSILGPAEEDAVSALAALVGGSEALELVMVVRQNGWLPQICVGGGNKKLAARKVSLVVSARQRERILKIASKILEDSMQLHRPAKIPQHNNTGSQETSSYPFLPLSLLKTLRILFYSATARCQLAGLIRFRHQCLRHCIP